MKSIGVDLGSTGLRVAHVDDDGRTEALPGAGESWPGVLMEMRPGSALGVTFPSLKTRLGLASTVTFDDRQQRPEELVTGVFRELRQEVEEQFGERVTEAVIAVPARYSAVQRAALRKAVMAAGFSEAHLLTDSVAAVMSMNLADREAVTALVYGAGYSGFELGLIRFARGRCRALGYEGGASPAGRELDRLLLEDWLAILKDNRFHLGVVGADWLGLRSRVQQVKEALSFRDRAGISIDLQNASGIAPVTISVTRSGLEEWVAPFFRHTLEHAEDLLAQAGLTPADLDQVLLVGGTARMPVLQRVISESLDKHPALLEAEDLARGAAAYAARLEGKPQPATAVQGPISEAREDGALLRSNAALRRAITITGTPDRAEDTLVLEQQMPADQAVIASPEGALEQADRLVRGGRGAEAIALLEAVIEKAQRLLAEAREAPAPVRDSPERLLARRALTRARRKLEQSKLEEAVRESHLAWKEDPDDPEIFEQMIDVHCQAALHGDSHEDKVRWLGCAQKHDQGNARVRELLAECFFDQARELHKRGQDAQALKTLEECFIWNPEHREAHKFQEVLIES